MINNYKLKVKKLSGIIFICFGILITNYNVVFAQITGEWFEVGIRKELPFNLRIKLSEEIRFYNSPIYMDQSFTEFDVRYKISRRFDVSLSYRFIKKREENNYYYTRHKFLFNFLCDIPINRFTLDYRIRIQKLTKSYINSEFDKIPDNYIRNKLKLSYDIRKNPLEPFLSFEIFYPLNAYKINTLDEYRAVLGTKYPINKKHSVLAGIMINRERFPIPLNKIVFLLSYDFNMN